MLKRVVKLAKQCGVTFDPQAVRMLRVRGSELEIEMLPGRGARFGIAFPTQQEAVEARESLFADLKAVEKPQRGIMRLFV